MSKSLRSPDHLRLIEILVAARKRAGLTQQDVADQLCKPQSFVAKYENGERRLDVVEFVAIAKAMNTDPARLFRSLLAPQTRPASQAGKPSPTGKKATSTSRKP